MSIPTGFELDLDRNGFAVMSPVTERDWATATFIGFRSLPTSMSARAGPAEVWRYRFRGARAQVGLAAAT